MPSVAHTRFRENRKDIDTLWRFRRTLTESSVKAAQLEVLNRAAIVFISACWESYVEDVATEAFTFLLDNATTPDIFPTKVRTLASKELFEQQDPRRLWELVNGWRNILKTHQDTILGKYVAPLNTPKKRPVKELFTALFDLDVTASWSWEGTTTDQAGDELDWYLCVRGDIAHRTRHIQEIEKKNAKDFLAHVVKLVDATEAALEAHVRSLVGTAPW